MKYMPPLLSAVHPDKWSAPFWEAARRHEFVCPRCSACGTFRMPPSPYCWKCRSGDVEWVRLPGTGTVYAFTVVRHAVIPDLKDYVPYVVGIIALDGTAGVRFIGNVVGPGADETRIGDLVRVQWDDYDAELTVARFVRMASAERGG